MKREEVKRNTLPLLIKNLSWESRILAYLACDFRLEERKTN